MGIKKAKELGCKVIFLDDGFSKYNIKKFDIYISTGGPGNPLEGDGKWDEKYYNFIDQLSAWNEENKIKKQE